MQTQTASKKISEVNPSNKPRKIKYSLSERRSDELIFGLVGPIFSGSSTTAKRLGELFNEQFNYETGFIKISDFLDDPKHTSKESAHNRIDRLQTRGNELRKQYGNSYLAKKAVEKIALERTDKGYENETGPCRNRRVVHFIDSLKHPEEVELLRDVYGDLFWLVGVFAPEPIRKSRAKGKIEASELDGIFLRDESEDLIYGQQVRDTMHLADFFIRNDEENTDGLIKTIERFLNTLFNTEVITPLADEKAMLAAASAACGSACLSRQVGAVIYNKQGELLGVGRNDPPKFGGGLYSDEDKGSDHRCHKWQEKCCHNDKRKDLLYSNISNSHVDNMEKGLKKILKKFVKTQGFKGDLEKLQHQLDKFVPEEIASISRQILKTSEIKDLIEYSRAVHAEMEAIISVARTGKNGLIGSTLYCTTFPCHNCAKHIIAAGIEKVVFIEPYPKSLAMDLHCDAISTSGVEDGKKVQFIQYEGIAPKNMMKMYQISEKRKKEGKVVQKDPRKATPIFRPPLDGFSRYEQIVVASLKKCAKKS